MCRLFTMCSTSRLSSCQLSLLLLLFVMLVLYQVYRQLSRLIMNNSRISGKYSTLQKTVCSCPSEHSLPSCRGDTRGAGGAVSDVVGEACCCHVCIVSSSCLFVKCRLGIVASYQRCLLSPIACLVQATSGGFVKDDGDCDNEKGVHGVCFLVVVVVSYTCIILILSAKVNPSRHSKFYFVKVVISRYYQRSYGMRNRGSAFFTNVRARVYCRAIAGSRLCTSTHARVGRLIYPHLLGLLPPRMPSCIRDTDHDDRDQNCDEHCGCDDCVCHVCIVPKERVFVKCKAWGSWRLNRVACDPPLP